MNQLFRPQPPPRRTIEEDEPFYGWRYVPRQQPDGTEKYEEVPLRKEDLLYPEEGDYIVNNPAHARDLYYCGGALMTYFRDDPGVTVLSDCRVDFGVAGIRPLGPDVLVLFGVRHPREEWENKGTFHLAEEGGKPVVVLEVASQTTYENDVGVKKDLYHRIGVRRYVIVDRGPKADGPAQLIGYERTRQGWRTMRPDARGRLTLAPLPLRIGIEDNRPWLYDATTGERLRDLTEAETKAQEEEKARKKAEAKVRRAEAKARKAEEDRRTAEARANAEAEERRKSVEEWVALEKRVRELEKQLRRQQGQS